ncbi:MAG: low molecular weight protein-tyrosine-phosphatase [Myxococcales bacterium]
MDGERVRICFVCLGNICRSPTAEGIMLALVKTAGLAGRIEIDSAGTAAYHVGERADRRSRQTAQARGVDLPSIARAFERSDFERFHYVLAMDEQNQRNLLALASTPAARSKVHLLRSFEPEHARDDLSVPDPYYGGPEGFERVFDICDSACRGLLAHVQREHGL